MGNVNELQEREGSSIDDSDSSNSEQDSSSSSDSIVSEHHLVLLSDCPRAEINDVTAAVDNSITLPQVSSSTDIPAPFLLRSDVQHVVEVTSSEVDEAVELSMNDIDDDSFPLSESAIPASFEILDDLSPVPSDISGAFHTPDISYFGTEDVEEVKQLNLPCNPFESPTEQKHGYQNQKQFNSELMEREKSPGSVESVLKIWENMQTVSTAVIDSDTIPKFTLRDSIIKGESPEIVSTEGHPISLGLNRTTFRGQESGEISFVSLAPNELPPPSLTRIPGPATAPLILEEMVSNEPTTLSADHIDPVPIVAKIHPFQHNLLPCEPEDTSQFSTYLAAQEGVAMPSEDPSEYFEQNSTSLSIKLLLEMPSHSEGQERFLTITEYYDLNPTLEEDILLQSSDDTSLMQVESTALDGILSDSPQHCPTLTTSPIVIEEFSEASNYPSSMLMDGIRSSAEISSGMGMPTTNFMVAENEVLKTIGNISETPVESACFFDVPPNALELEITPTAVEETPTLSTLQTSLQAMRLNSPICNTSVIPVDSATVCASMASIWPSSVSEDIVVKPEGSVLSTSTSHADVPLLTPEHPLLPVEPIQDTPVVTCDSQALFPSRHTADRPNWAIAPDTPPNTKIESPNKRRKRAPRRGKQVIPNSEAPTQGETLSSFKERWRDTPKVKRTNAQAFNTGPSAHISDRSSHGKKPHSAGARSYVVANNVNADHDNAGRPLPPTIPDTNNASNQHSVQPQSLGETRERPALGSVLVASKPKLVQEIISLEPLSPTNIIGHDKQANPLAVKDEARDFPYSPSPNHDPRKKHGKDQETGNSNIKGPVLSIVRHSKDAPEHDRLVRSSSVAGADSLGHSAHFSSSGEQAPLPHMLAENQGGKRCQKIHDQNSSTGAIQLGVSTFESPKNMDKLHADKQYKKSQGLTERSSVNNRPSFPVGSVASHLPARHSWPVTEEVLRSGSTLQLPLMAPSEAVRSAVSNSPLTTGFFTPLNNEESFPVPHIPSAGTTDIFTVETKAQYGEFNEPLVITGNIPTARVNLPAKRSSSIASEKEHKDNRHVRISPIQSGIPVLTKNYALKDSAIKSAPGPLLLHHSESISEFGQSTNDRVIPENVGLRSSSQNTSQSYTMPSVIGTSGRTGSSFILNRDLLSNARYRNNRTSDSTPFNSTRSTHVSTPAPVHVLPTGVSQSQVSMYHHQRNAGHRTQHGYLSGNLQRSADLVSVGQNYNTGLTEFVYETPIPLRRYLHDFVQHLPADSTHSKEKDMR